MQLSYHEKIKEIETACKGPVAAAKKAGVNYITWWRIKKNDEISERWKATIDLLYESTARGSHEDTPVPLGQVAGGR